MPPAERKGDSSMLTLHLANTVNNSLLEEVSRTEWLLDPISLCVAVSLGFIALGLTLAYIVLGRSWPRARSPARLCRLTVAH